MDVPNPVALAIDEGLFQVTGLTMFAADVRDPKVASDAKQPAPERFGVLTQFWVAIPVQLFLRIKVQPHLRRAFMREAALQKARACREDRPIVVVLSPDIEACDAATRPFIVERRASLPVLFPC